jgi:hypothetical protein
MMEKLLYRLEMMPFEIANVEAKGDELLIVMEGLPDRRVVMATRTESWKVKVICSGGVMRVRIKAKPEVLERDVNDIVMVIVAAILLTIPQQLVVMLNPLNEGW